MSPMDMKVNYCWLDHNEWSTICREGKLVREKEWELGEGKEILEHFVLVTFPIAESYTW